MEIQHERKLPIESRRPLVDVVIVSYCSREELRETVDAIVAEPDIRVIVVDNNSPDASLEAIADLDVTALRLPRNGGFAHGCNTGWQCGDAPYVLLLNPDARVSSTSIRQLVTVIEQNERIGIVAPRIENEGGTLAFSLRRFPRLRATYARAVFLHRLFRRLPG